MNTAKWSDLIVLRNIIDPIERGQAHLPDSELTKVETHSSLKGFSWLDVKHST